MSDDKQDQTEDNQDPTSDSQDHMEAMRAAMEETAGEQEASAEPVDHMAAMAAAMAETGSAEPEPVSPEASAAAIARTVGGSDVNIEALLKVPVSLSIEVGRKKMPLDDLLSTQEGSVIELERMLDEPLDILVNGALIAHGVVVLADDRFGIQITDIISLEERARSL